MAEPDGILAHQLTEQEDRSLVECVFLAARLGDPAVLQLLREIGHFLGIALANLVNFFNPELIILGGLFAQAEDLILPVAQETLNRLAFAGLGEKVKLVTTSFGWRAGVTGAAALALLAFFYGQSAITQLPVTAVSQSNPFVILR